MAEREPQHPDEFIEFLTDWLNQPSDSIVKLPPSKVQTSRQDQEDKRRLVQENLTGKTSFERVEAEYPYLVDANCYSGSPKEWAELAQEWADFKSVLKAGDELWEFYHVESFGGPFCNGEEGIAVVCQGKVVPWKTMVVIS